MNLVDLVLYARQFAKLLLKNKETEHNQTWLHYSNKWKANET